jgi:hypothetical protein
MPALAAAGAAFVALGLFAAPPVSVTARFLAGSFRKAGLLPAGDTGTYLQTFEFIDSVDVGAKTSLTTAAGVPAGRRWKAGSDFRPLPFSAAGEAEGEVVFAGYGISAPELGWDDYSGLDVKGKVVLVLRYSPDGDDAQSPFAPHTILRSKASRRERGARWRSCSRRVPGRREPATTWLRSRSKRRSATRGYSPSR